MVINPLRFFLITSTNIHPFYLDSTLKKYVICNGFLFSTVYSPSPSLEHLTMWQPPHSHSSHTLMHVYRCFCACVCFTQVCVKVKLKALNLPLRD